MSNVIVYLSSRLKHRPRSSQEYRMLPMIVCPEFGLYLEGDGPLVERMASLLAENNCDISRGYEVRRGDTTCFEVVPLNAWVNREDRRPEQLKRIPQ